MNFLPWKTQLLNILDSYNLQGFVNGEIQQPPSFIDGDSAGSIPDPTFLLGQKTNRRVEG